MANMMRLLLAVAAAAGSVAAGSVQSSGNQFEIVFGSYAVIVTGGDTLDMATIKKPNVFSTDYEPHPLHLTVAQGYIDQAETTVPTEELDGHTLGWDLTGLTVEVLNDGQPLPKEPITLPPYTKVSICDEQAPTGDQLNNRFFLPDLTAISGQQSLKSDVDSRLDGRLRVYGGTLKVTALAPGCFDFKKGGQTVHTQRLANGHTGLTYSHAMGGQITLSVAQKGKPVRQITIVPQDGTVRLAVHPRHVTPSTANRPIKHFKYFYSLLRNSVHADDRLIPTWLGAENLIRSPGEACPPGFYEIP